jgi:hypothetical protein
VDCQTKLSSAKRKGT